MTVGMYINAPYAVMLSDCLVLPSKGGRRLFSPSNIELFDGENGELASLVSKFINIDSKTILAFAGLSDDILEFADNFPKLWAERDPNLRPMQFVHQLDNDLRACRPGWSCSVLGVSVVLNDAGVATHANNYASFGENWQFTTTNFGACFSIGSGSGELRQFIENADKNITKTQLAPVGKEFLYKQLGALNGKTLYLQEEAVDAQSWGGILQAQFFDIDDCKWRRTPPWFHIAVFYEGEDVVFKGMHKKAVLHSSKMNDQNASIVVTFTANEHGEYSNILWPVFSPLVSEETRIEALDINCSDIPELVTITQFFLRNGRISRNHSTYYRKQVQGLSFTTSDTGFGWCCDGEKLASWLRQQLANDSSLSFILG